MKNVRFVLASGSPRRRELLEQMGIDAEILPMATEEASIGMDPAELVMTNAYAKGKLAAALRPNAVIIAADTIVLLDNVVFGKPKDEVEAKEMLQTLSGRGHRVYTGISVITPEGKQQQKAVETKVWFRRLKEDEIEKYVATGEPLDKAGAYGIQGRGAVFVEHIAGDYNNVVGLPLAALYTMLQGLGYPIW